MPEQAPPPRPDQTWNLSGALEFWLWQAQHSGNGRKASRAWGKIEELLSQLLTGDYAEVNLEYQAPNEPTDRDLSRWADQELDEAIRRLEENDRRPNSDRQEPNRQSNGRYASRKIT